MEKDNKNKSFWNWGTGITITIIVAIGLMSFLVYKTTTIQFEMVENDYYAQELKYNDVLIASRNAQALSSRIELKESADFVTIVVPQECMGNDVSGEILLYRPSSEQHDVTIDFKPDSNRQIIISKKKLITGIYKLKADWKIGDMPFHDEQSFYLENSVK